MSRKEGGDEGEDGEESVGCRERKEGKKNYQTRPKCQGINKLPHHTVHELNSTLSFSLSLSKEYRFSRSL